MTDINNNNNNYSIFISSFCACFVFFNHIRFFLFLSWFIFPLRLLLAFYLSDARFCYTRLIVESREVANFWLGVQLSKRRYFRLNFVLCFLVSYAERVLNQPGGSYIVKKLHSLFIQTVEPRYNGPPYNEVLGVTNDFLYPNNSKTYEKDPQYNETVLSSEQMLPLPWPCVITRSHCSHLLIAMRKQSLGGEDDFSWLF